MNQSFSSGSIIIISILREKYVQIKFNETTGEPEKYCFARRSKVERFTQDITLKYVTLNVSYMTRHVMFLGKKKRDLGRVFSTFN